MKFKNLIIMVLFIFVLSGCGVTSGTEKQATVVNEIEKYITFNEAYNAYFDAKLDDVVEKDVYEYSDFFNYENKDPKNVELEYSAHYKAYQNLVLIKNYINFIEDFEFNTYIDLEEFGVTIHVIYDNDKIKIDYYEYFDDLDVVIRQFYVLSEEDEHITIDKYSTTYDLRVAKTINVRRMTVIQDEYIEDIEYFPETHLFSFIHNSYTEQEYFKYRAEFNDDYSYARETVEIYVDEYRSFVSYDIKDEALEDYRVKIFEDGHRIVKVDVNIFKSKETIVEFTWNLLSVEGWSYITMLNDNYKVYQDLGDTLDDYLIDIQLKGYGKVTAYKEKTGELINSDMSLVHYGLDSGLTALDVRNAHDEFVNTYVDKMAFYGFGVSDPYNYDQLLLKFTAFNNRGIMEEFITRF